MYQNNINFKNLIKAKLSSNYKLYSEVVMKMCTSFYNKYIDKSSKAPTIDFYDSYAYKNTYALNKFVMISFLPDSYFILDREFKEYEINNSEEYYYYGFDNINNIFYFENRFYLLYDLLFSNKFNKKLDEFLDYINIFVAYYDNENNSFYISKKPLFEEVFSEINFQKSFLDEKFFIGRITIPKWLYCSSPDELNIDNYIILHNADIKAEFIKKAGADKLLSLGTIVDTYENYPDNEWWAKSEYKLIDMHKIVPPKKIYYEGHRRRTVELKPCKYAPFLYMKNQTTGVIHLEGVHPECRNLYDALKMRYRGLNLPNFEIKNIK